MDVRCDRCQTEYELDDESVADSGAQVQCTTCGHTFVVSRTGATLIGAVTPPAGLPDVDGPAGAAWTLATEDGRTHQCRDLTTLQKWIVERRVTRNDRVSQRGGASKRLGDMEELRAFFDVVEQADRTRRAEVSRVRPTQPASPRRGRVSATPPPLPREVDAADILATSPTATPGDSGAFGTSFGVDGEMSLRGGGRYRRQVRVGAVMLIAALVPVAAYVGLKSAGRAGPAPPSVAAASKGSAPPAPAAAAPPPSPPPVATAPPPVAAAPPPPAPPPPPAAAPPPAALPPPSAATPPSSGAHGDSGKAVASSDSGSGRPKSYERLIEEADRALENGATNKAQRLYDEALKIQPDGAAALTGSAFLMLDRQRTLSAIVVFKRALANTPGFAPALFGLAGAYRAQGDSVHALEAYKQYLSAAPSGPDATAARRQVREIEGDKPERRAESTPAPADSPKTEAPPAPPGDQPTP